MGCLGDALKLIRLRASEGGDCRLSWTRTEEEALEK